MLSPDGRWFTETGRNSDGVKHAKVYQNLDDLDMFFIGFENLEGGGDKDYNDMVICLKRIKSVGGVWTPLQEFSLLGPRASLVPAVLLTAFTLVFLVKFRKRR